jgi:hypothetical protein
MRSSLGVLAGGRWLLHKISLFAVFRGGRGGQGTYLQQSQDVAKGPKELPP